MNGIGLSFYVNFEADKLKASVEYSMEKLAAEWLRDTISKADTEALHKKLVEASGMFIPNFFLSVVADKSDAKDEAVVEKLKEGQPT